MPQRELCHPREVAGIDDIHGVGIDDIPGAGIHDRGSMIPFVLLSFLIAVTMVCGGIAASVGFLEQRDVQSVCDGAAVVAANQIDEGGYFLLPGGDTVPLSQQSVDAAVGGYLASAGQSMHSWSASTDGRSVRVVCTRYVDIPFNDVFLAGQQLERTAVALARSPYQP